MTILLVGYRGCGKSTVGRRMASELWYKFADTDEMIVRSAGKTIREIFEQQGEAAFRDMESTVLGQALSLTDHVIALGGGAVLREENRAAIKSSGHKVIYLRCEPETLLRRIQSDPATAATRPPLTNLGGGIEEIRALLAEREPLYRQVMTKELEVTHLSEIEAAKYALRML